MLSLDRPKEAMSQIIHGAGVVYIKEEGEGIGRGLSTATEDSLWKMPRLPIQDSDVIRVEHAFPHAVSCAARVCVSSSACVCVCISGGRWNEHRLMPPTCCITFRPSSAVPQGCCLLNDSLMYIEWTAQQAHVHGWFILRRCDNVNILINQAVIEGHMLRRWLILITTCHPALDNTDLITHIRTTKYKVECVCV